MRDPDHATVKSGTTSLSDIQGAALSGGRNGNGASLFDEPGTARSKGGNGAIPKCTPTKDNGQEHLKNTGNPRDAR